MNTNQVVKQISGSKNPQIQVLEEMVAKLKPSILASIKNLKIGIDLSRKHLQNDNDKITATLGKIPQKERLLLDISRQQSVKNAIYTFLLQKKEESAIAAAAILPNYRVIEKPEYAGVVYPVPGKVRWRCAPRAFPFRSGRQHSSCVYKLE